MAEEPQDAERLAVNLAWVGVEDVPILFANQILSQVDDKGEIILTFGQVTPPILLGTAEEQRQQAAMVPFVQVRPTARLSLSRARVNELITVLQKTLENQATVSRTLEEDSQ